LDVLAENIQVQRVHAKIVKLDKMFCSLFWTLACQFL
jgi:hypothetical protein